MGLSTACFDAEEMSIKVRSCAGLCAQVNLGTGALERWEVAGHSLLAAGVAPCLFRAPLDNDLGGSGKTSFASRCCVGLSTRCRSCPLRFSVHIEQCACSLRAFLVCAGWL